MKQSMKWLAITGLLVAIACSGTKGDPGQPCTITSNSDGSKTLTCPDGTDVVIKNGTNGANGTNGSTGSTGYRAPRAMGPVPTAPCGRRWCHRSVH